MIVISDPKHSYNMKLMVLVSFNSEQLCSLYSSAIFFYQQHCFTTWNMHFDLL